MQKITVEMSSTVVNRTARSRFDDRLGNWQAVGRTLVDRKSRFQFQFVQRGLRTNILGPAIFVSFPVPALESTLCQGFPNERSPALAHENILGDFFKIPLLHCLLLEC